MNFGKCLNQFNPNPWEDEGPYQCIGNLIPAILFPVNNLYVIYEKRSLGIVLCFSRASLLKYRIPDYFGLIKYQFFLN